MHMKRTISALTTLCLAVAGAAIITSTPSFAKTMVYVSAATDGEIDSYSMDMASGALTRMGSIAAGKSVMPMALSPDRSYLYAVVRSQPYRVMTYRIDPATGELKEAAVAALPDSMAYVSVEKKGRLLFLASYGGDKIASLPITADGLVKDGIKQVVLTGHNAHSIVSDRTGKYVFVTNLGSDVVLQFVLNQKTGMLEPNSPASVAAKAGQGPRHIVVSPDNKSVYIVTELSGDVIHYALDADKGTLTEQETTAVLAPGSGLEPGIAPPVPPAFDAPAKPSASAGATAAPPRIWAADIAITPDGKFLYASERSTSTLSIFSVSSGSGALTRVGSIDTEKQPRASVLIRLGGT